MPTKKTAPKKTKTSKPAKSGKKMAPVKGPKKMKGY